MTLTGLLRSYKVSVLVVCALHKLTLFGVNDAETTEVTSGGQHIRGWGHYQMPVLQ